MNAVKLGITGAFAGLLLAVVFAGDAGAFSRGPFLERTGAPGEQTCHTCHLTFPLDSGPGRLVVEGLPERYTPGQFYEIAVRLEDPRASVWGFEITAVDEEGRAAGFFQKHAFDDRTIETLGPGERFGRYYARHTIYGNFAGQRNAATWLMRWKAPAEDVGPVTLYAVGNAADGDHSDLFDYIYSTNITVEGQTRNVRVRLVAPATGSVWGAGETVVVRWTATDGETASPASFRVELSTDGGAQYPTVLADDLAADARSFVWHVPAALRTDEARLRVVARDTSGVERSDASRADARVALFGLERRALVAVPAPAVVREIAWGDVRPGGALEAAVVSSDGRLALYARSDAGELAAIDAGALGAVATARAVAFGDVDADGDADLALLTTTGVALYRNDGQGVFAIVGAPTTLAGLRAIAWADVDADGALDLVATGSNGTVGYILTASGLVAVANAWGLGEVRAEAIAVAGDLVAFGGADGARVFTVGASGAVEATASEMRDAGAIAALAWSDATGDAVLDLVAVGAGGAHVYAGAGDAVARWSERTAALGLAGTGPLDTLAAGDYDGDARADLFVASAAGARKVFHARAAGFEDATARFDLREGASRAEWVDADGDRTLDLVAVGPSGATLFANLRPATQTLAIRALADGRAAAGAVAWIDADGDLDWTTGNRMAIPLERAETLVMTGSERVAVRVLFRDASGREAVVETSAGAVALEPGATGEIASARAKAAKLVLDGARLPVAAGAVEVDRRALETIKAPARFRDPDGTSRRLVAKGASLAALLAARPVAIRVLDRATGAVSRPFVLD